MQNLGALAEFDHHCQYEMLGVPENSLGDFYYLNRHPDGLSTDAMLLRPQKITVLNNDPIISRFSCDFANARDFLAVGRLGQFVASLFEQKLFMAMTDKLGTSHHRIYVISCAYFLRVFCCSHPQ